MEKMTNWINGSIVMEEGKEEEQTSFGYDDLPIDMRFNAGHVVSIVTYSILMIISAIGNITVLTLLLRRKGNVTRTRINTMLIHLAIADLLVTFLMMPLEIGWAITVSWKLGDAMCRIMAFFRMFGLYLSSFILVCISIDRYHAVLRPLQMIDIDRRGKFMIASSWICSALCSAPQMLVFHVEAHPKFTWYKQCITFNTFPSFTHELTYSLFGMVMMYWFPLIVIIYTYTSILAEMYRRSKDTNSDKIRRSSLGFLGRARVRTLKMTIIIVLVFFICWTPYYVMSLWYWIDRESATKVDLRVQKALFLFACTNSCMNPIVYGAFNIRKGNKGLTRLREMSGSERSHQPSIGSYLGQSNCSSTFAYFNQDTQKIITCSSKSSTNDGKAGSGCREPWTLHHLESTPPSSNRSSSTSGSGGERPGAGAHARHVRIQTQISLIPLGKYVNLDIDLDSFANNDKTKNNNVSVL